MRKFVAVAAVVAALAVSPVAAQPHVVGLDVDFAGSEVTVSGKVVGLGNQDGPVDVRTELHVTCANGQETYLGLTASLSTDRGNADFEVSSGMLLSTLGCDQVVSAELVSVEVE